MNKFKIKILLDIYFCYNLKDQVSEKTKNELISLGLIKYLEDDTYRLTEAGIQYIERLGKIEPTPNFKTGDLVRKKSGSEWVGRVCGQYSTELTPDGYAVESANHKGSVQIYPGHALELYFK